MLDFLVSDKAAARGHLSHGAIVRPALTCRTVQSVYRV